MWEAICGLVFQRGTTQKPANALWVCTRQPDDMLSRVTVVMHTMEDVETTYLVKSNFTSVQIAIWSKEVRFRRTAAADQ